MGALPALVALPRTDVRLKIFYNVLSIIAQNPLRAILKVKMNKKFHGLNPFLLFFAGFLSLLGGYIRLFPAFMSDFPVNDGGLFYQMTQDLLQNGYALPLTTQYNQMEIAFAYPPLGFYLSAFFHAVSGLPLIDIFRFLPGMFAAASIPAFFLLANDLLKSRAQTALATMAFAFLPSAFYWPIMGGGLTRAPGFFFSLLAYWSAYRLYTVASRRNLLATACFASCAILSHPEAALHTVTGIALFFVFYGRNRAGFLHSILVAFLVLSLTAPWWLTVLNRHGLTPFLTASRAGGGYRLDLLLSIFHMNLTDEPALTFLGCFAALGLFSLSARKIWLVPAWGLVILLTEQRSMILHLTPVLALSAGVGMDDFFTRLRQLTNSSHPSSPQEWASALFSNTASQIAFGFLLVSFILSAFEVAFTEAKELSLPPGDRTAFQWVNEKIPPGARFLILTGDQPLADPVAEWFPALTSQKSLATVQGREWHPASNFDQVLRSTFTLQQCVLREAACLREWQARDGREYDYLYISKARIRANHPALGQSIPLVNELLKSDDFEILYDTEQTAILKKR